MQQTKMNTNKSYTTKQDLKLFCILYLSGSNWIVDPAQAGPTIPLDLARCRTQNPSGSCTHHDPTLKWILHR